MSRFAPGKLRSVGRRRVELCGIVGNEILAVIKSPSWTSKVSTEKKNDFKVSTVVHSILLSESYSADAGLIFCLLGSSQKFCCSSSSDSLNNKKTQREITDSLWNGREWCQTCQNLLPCFAKDTFNTSRTGTGRADEKKRAALWVM